MKNIGKRLKTNMAMEVKINDEFSIHVSHKDGMCDLRAVFEYGNKVRARQGKNPIVMREWLRNSNTQEFITSHEKISYLNSNCGCDPQLESRTTIDFSQLNCYKATRGKYGKTRADLYLTIKAAAALDTDLEVLIYTVFINDNILVKRDEGGDSFKKLMKAIDKHMPGREDKKDNKGLYINTAKKIREGLGCKDLADWNVRQADATLHHQRNAVETALITLLENEMVEGTGHLWLLIEKQCDRVRNQG